jgi:hypothetical protein
LLEKTWLRPEGDGTDDAGLRYGHHARFWVEPVRRDEFERASDARRAAWAWRSYVSAVRSSGVSTLEIRYELVAESPTAVAHEVSAYLDAPLEPLAAAFREAHAESVGRYVRDLDDEQLADVLDEAGDLLEELGYA